MAPTTRSKRKDLSSLSINPADSNEQAGRSLSVIKNEHFDEAPLVNNNGHVQNAHSNSILERGITGQHKRKRENKAEPEDEAWDILPHGMGKNNNLTSAIADGDLETMPPKKKRSTPKNISGDVPKKGRVKAHPYGLTPGRSPFPEHIMPTPEACEEVHRLLKCLHDPKDLVKPPKEIPPPSMDVAGCGEVPDLLDAMLRTLLSAATTKRNSDSSIKSLGAKFGERTVGLGKGSANWDAIHDASFSEVFDAIKQGGLAKSKTTNIKAILDIVYKRNVKIRDALLKEKETGEPATGLGAKYDTQEEKDAQLARFDETLLCLDYIFELTSEEAMDEMTKLPGIGVKTASCVILFNMQRPSFAVDTHVWRLCKWLGWVPQNANRDKTFSHCEVRVPDHLKYALHQLFIRHGKLCKRCKASTSPTSEEFKNEECPLEHLVKRTGKRKTIEVGTKRDKNTVKKGAKGKGVKKGTAKKDESEEAESIAQETDDEAELSEESESSEHNGDEADEEEN